MIRRTILKQELAAKLFPQSANINAAMQLLQKEIKISRKLNNQLNSLTRNRRAHYYTHKEVEAILAHFGVSREEFEMLKQPPSGTMTHQINNPIPHRV